MLSVMREIVAFQEAFFTLGEGHLRPLILKDIALRINMDISTIRARHTGRKLDLPLLRSSEKHTPTKVIRDQNPHLQVRTWQETILIHFYGACT